MKEFEIVAKFCNTYAGSSRPQTFFEEAQSSSTDAYVRRKHSRDFAQFVKDIPSTGASFTPMTTAV